MEFKICHICHKSNIIDNIKFKIRCKSRKLDICIDCFKEQKDTINTKNIPQSSIYIPSINIKTKINTYY